MHANFFFPFYHYHFSLKLKLKATKEKKMYFKIQSFIFPLSLLVEKDENDTVHVKDENQLIDSARNSFSLALKGTLLVSFLKLFLLP